MVATTAISWQIKDQISDQMKLITPNQGKSRGRALMKESCLSQSVPAHMNTALVVALEHCT